MRALFPSRPFLLAILFATLLGALSGCSTTSSEAYNKQLSDAKTAYDAGKITTAEYLKLTQDAQNAYLQRQSSGD
ncbi:MAG: hypothetical protein ABSH19_02310 [Opitutales bacterium]